MRCQRCGREINPLRLLTDRDFCSERCRKKGTRASAWFLRDAEYDSDPLWMSPSADVVKPQPKGSNSMMAVVMVGLVGALVVAKLVFPDDSAARGGSSPVARSAPATLPAVPPQESRRMSGGGGVLEWLESRLPGSGPVIAKVDFQSNLGEWSGSGKGWVVREGAARVGELRLWTPTLGTRDYELEFEGQVERRGLSWVYRASGADRYYATRIQIVRAGAVSGAKIIRYGVEAGGVFAKMELPLPVPLERGRSYRVATLVAGTRFTTLIDGKVVDEWSDPRLVKGGVGFFAADGEESVLHWARFRERKSLWDRFASANLLLAPGLTP